MKKTIILMAALASLSLGYGYSSSNIATPQAKVRRVKHIKKQASKYHPHAVKHATYELSNEMPTAKSYISNASKMPKKTKITWKEKPNVDDLDEEGRTDASVKVTFPDKSKKTVNFEVTCFGTNFINQPDGYTPEALAKADNDNSASPAFVKATAKGMRINNYIPESPADFKEKVSFPNLTSSQKAKLGDYAVRLIDTFRTPFGTQPVAYDPDAQILADQVALRYKKDNYAYSQGHDIAGLQDVLLGAADAYAEDMDATRFKPNNMNDMKRMIYNNLVRFLFNVNEWHHAGSIAGTGDDLSAMAVSYSKSSDGLYVTHYIFLP